MIYSRYSIFRRFVSSSVIIKFDKKMTINSTFSPRLSYSYFKKYNAYAYDYDYDYYDDYQNNHDNIIDKIDNIDSNDNKLKKQSINNNIPCKFCMGKGFVPCNYCTDGCMLCGFMGFIICSYCNQIEFT